MSKLILRNFTMVEIICAMALAGILFGAFASTMLGVNKASKTFANETKATVILGNILERSKGTPKTLSAIKAIAENEFNASDLGKGKQFKLHVTPAGKRVLIKILRIKGKRCLGEVTL
ncbi:MAG: prepilin-type N-terminal cleavage/methylation domain-containing protein [Lentisphaerae bacterium]|nr:prepilin-type N-terminal cleavage/methylation domain-containing protein [Lentisphaerota bacterium]MCP4101647.1 prepilin-type N-terminal cleavage/methylation domain-containing protein [Lentisphaerota bacterium]